MNYKWTLAEANANGTFSGKRGKVFSCFAGCGGSSMGYKLAGFDVIGRCELDPKQAKLYDTNLHPRLRYDCDVRELQTLELPAEMFSLDILDGSPPCSTFTMSGQRNKVLGKEKKFAEGQKFQRLDNLPFEFIKVAERLQPKVVVLENVPAMLIGDMRVYARMIVQQMENAGYRCHVHLVTYKDVGLPQKRERLFFVGLRKNIPHLKFDATPRPPKHVPTYGEILCGCLGGMESRYRPMVSGENFSAKKFIQHASGKSKCYQRDFVEFKKTLPTQVAQDVHVNPLTGHYLCRHELCAAQSFPQDFDFCGQKPAYAIGMSVPPLFIAEICSRLNL